MTHLFAVTGEPVLHSLSPEMFRAAFTELGEDDSNYLRLAAPHVEDALATARSIGISGMNITSPFKTQAFARCDWRDTVADATASVNTIRIEEKVVHGYNTDPLGVSGAFARAGVNVRGKNVLVLGTGGAGRAALFALRKAGAYATEWRRGETPARRPFDILVGCTGEQVGIDLKEILHPDLVVFDAFYAYEAPLQQEAKRLGCAVISGKEWLLYQGLSSFKILTGGDAPYVTMDRALNTPRKARPQIIALIGMMGSGKSTVAGLLGEKLKLPVRDLDREIEELRGAKIEHLFQAPGEENFRQTESTLLARILSGLPCILACGGGVVLREANRALLKANSVPVWLWASAQVIKERIAGTQNRPLLAGTDVGARLKELIHERKLLYADCSALLIDTDRATPTFVTDRIAYEIRETEPH